MLFNKPGFRLIIILFSINQLVSGKQVLFLFLIDFIQCESMYINDMWCPGFGTLQKASFMTGKTIASYGFIHDS